jgi:putative ABC transport system substrate-binding protein
MRRRQFTKLVGAAAVGWPLAARAQSDRVRRIGVLMSAAEGDAPSVARLTAFREKLDTLGWTVGHNLQIDYRWDVFDPERAKATVSELLRLSPDVIIANSVSATQAAKQATNTVPIIFTVVSEPISLGFVASLSHPGGNVIGFTTLEPSIATRWLELLKEIAPEITRAAFMFNPDSTRASPLFYKSIEVAAAKLSIEPVMVMVRQAEEIETVLGGLGERSGLIVQPDTFLNFHRKLIFNSADRHSLPAVYPYGWYAREGGLMAYGPDIVEQFRLAGGYVDRILRGANPADLPVQQPTKFELVINPKVAKVLGLIVPPTLLAIADEVIE